jgi:hypothetical protein
VNVAEEIGWPVNDLLKSVRGAQRLVDRVYGSGRSLPLVESIVESINAVSLGNPLATARSEDQTVREAEHQ